MKLQLTKIDKQNYTFTHDGIKFTGSDPEKSARESLVKYQMDKEGKNYLENVREFSLRVKKIQLEYING